VFHAANPTAGVTPETVAMSSHKGVPETILSWGLLALSARVMSPNHMLRELNYSPAAVLMTNM
jgi:hypothetical protein